MQVALLGQVVHLKNIELSRYGNNALAVVANMDWGDGYTEPSKLSINLAEGPSAGQVVTSDMLAEDCFHCPNYSEHSAIFDAFLKAELIEVVAGPHPSGYVMIPVCRLTDKGLALVEMAPAE